MKTGYAHTDDGQELYWRVVGAGPALVCCNGVGVSTFFWRYVVEHFSPHHSVLLWDYRGHGRSSVPTDVAHADLSIERCADDLATVLDAAEIGGRSVLLGHSMGCQVVLETARRHPDRVAGLIPMFGTFARPLDSFFDNPNSRYLFSALRRIAAVGGRVGQRLLKPLYDSPIALPIASRVGLVDRYYASPRDMRMYLDHLGEMNVNVFLSMVNQIADHDLTEFLPTLRVPALVIAGERDLFTPLHRSREMARLIPGAELFVLAEGSHAAIVEHPNTINRRIDRFLEERLGAWCAGPGGSRRS